MRFNIPLLPLRVEFQFGLRWRPLPRFRISIWSVMLMVAVAGVFFAAVRHISQLGVLNRYHAEQRLLDPGNAQWHMEMTNKYATAIYYVDGWVGMLMLTILVALVIGVAGRMLNWIGARRQDATQPQV